MDILSHRSLARLVVAGALAAALGLTGCGRKSGLDPPPAAAVAQPGPNGQPAPDTHFDEEGHPVAPPAAQRKSFFLDWLLD